MLRITAELAKTERGPISTSGPSLFCMSPNRAIRSERSNFSSPHAAAQPWGGSGHTLSGTKETWLAPMFPFHRYWTGVR